VFEFLDLVAEQRGFFKLQIFRRVRGFKFAPIRVSACVFVCGES